MRLGVLDVESNTVHLQMVDAAPGARPNPTANFYLKRGSADTRISGRLS
ncbi:MAG: hypothetical protein RL271_1115 [Actinomycetota bacterium]|jgi:hypothetical protein